MLHWICHGPYLLFSKNLIRQYATAPNASGYMIMRKMRFIHWFAKVFINPFSEILIRKICQVVIPIAPANEFVIIAATKIPIPKMKISNVLFILKYPGDKESEQD